MRFPSVTSPSSPSIWELEGRGIALWGAGKETASAYRAIVSRVTPARVAVVTDEPAPPADRERFPAGAPLHFASGEEGRDVLLRSEVVVRSPGVSVYRPEAAALAAAGVEVTTGTNLWFAEHAGDLVVAVTGSKGKSTTSALVSHLLRASGRTVVHAGNIGTPLLDHLDERPTPEAWVVELSSYQTADLRFSPAIGVVLNLHREHTDWHRSEANYYRDKLNLLGHPPGGRAVLNALDPRLVELTRGLPDVIWFGTASGFHVRDGSVWQGDHRLLDEEQFPLRGRHNAMNLCAALTVVDALWPEGSWGPLLETLQDFRALPHRLEVIGDVGGRTFVDDSIATTPQATEAALAAFAGRPVAVLVGGHDRGQDYGDLVEYMAASSDVRAVIGLPGNGPHIIDVLEQACARPGAHRPVLALAPDLEHAVAEAAQAVGPGGVVLLSPGAPSYGAFRNFEERGERFREAVRALKRQE